VRKQSQLQTFRHLFNAAFFNQPREAQAFRLAHPFAVLRGPFIAKGSIVCACASNMAPANPIRFGSRVGFVRAPLGVGSLRVASSP